MKRLNKRGIALLITLLFVMLITLSIGIGLKQVNEASSDVQSEKFLLQSSIVLDDILKILNDKAKEYKGAEDESGELFYSYLDMLSFPLIPLGNTDLKVGIQLTSARAKFSINSIVDNNGSKRALENYLSLKMVDGTLYVDILEDVIAGANNDYATDIFYEKPHLFKDKNNHIVSLKNLDEINDFYKQRYHNDNIDIINFKNLISFSDNKEYILDLNCASLGVLEILGLAQINLMDDGEVVEEESFCNIALCDTLTKEQKEDMKKYNAFCEPQKFLEVIIDIMQDDYSATIKFEYDILNAKGSNFVYEI